MWLLALEDHTDNTLMVCTKFVSSDTREPSQIRYIRSPTTNTSFGWNSLWPLTYVYVYQLSSDLLHLWVKSNGFCLTTSRFCSLSPAVYIIKKMTLPWSPYQMVLRINDTSLKPGHGPSYVSILKCELVLNTELVSVPKYHAVSWTLILSFPFRPPFTWVKWRSYPLKKKINVTRIWIGLCGEQVLLCLSGI